MALTQVKSDGIADGAVTTNDLSDSGVTAGTYGSSSAIPAITVDAKGRVTSASTSSIDSTAITNGTSNVSVAASGNITATRSGTTRLTVDSSGVIVHGNASLSSITSSIHWPESSNSFSRQWEIIGDQGSNGRLEVKYGGADGASPDEVALRMDANGATSLFHDNSQKLATTSTGIDVTGEATVDGIHIGSGKIRGDSSNHVFIQGGNTVQVYVSDSGNDSTGTGESNSPVRTINRAIELLPKVMGNQTLQIRIQGSSYTTTSNQMIRGFSFNGSNDVSRFFELTSDSGTVTFNLRHGLDFYNVHGFRVTGINFVVESGYSGGLRFISCTEGQVYNSCSFTTSSTSGWSERIAFANSRRVRFDANVTATSSASAGLGGLIVINDKSQVDMYGTVSKSGTLFNNTGIAVVNGSELRGGVDVNNFRDGIFFGVNHYNAESGARGMLNGVTVSNCTTGIKLWNNSFVRKYSVQYSGNGTNETINSTNGGNFT